MDSSLLGLIVAVRAVVERFDAPDQRASRLSRDDGCQSESVRIRLGAALLTVVGWFASLHVALSVLFTDGNVDRADMRSGWARALHEVTPVMRRTSGEATRSIKPW